jgi:hypothetical protein
MGQVWSKADFDGIREAGQHGGTGSVLAVTAQNSGGDEVWGTNDDVLAPLNRVPIDVSIDASPGPDCHDDLDRVRGFHSFHTVGSYFVFADGSVRFIDNNVDPATYRAMSTIDSGEVVGP